MFHVKDVIAVFVLVFVVASVTLVSARRPTDSSLESMLNEALDSSIGNVDYGRGDNGRGGYQRGRGNGGYEKGYGSTHWRGGYGKGYGSSHWRGGYGKGNGGYRNRTNGYPGPPNRHPSPVCNIPGCDLSDLWANYSHDCYECIDVRGTSRRANIPFSSACMNKARCYCEKFYKSEFKYCHAGNCNKDTKCIGPYRNNDDETNPEQSDYEY